MAREKENLTGPLDCRHCGNRAPMREVATHSQMTTDSDERTGMEWSSGDIFEMLECMTCKGISLRSYYWHDEAMDPTDVKYEHLYPVPLGTPGGLPPAIAKEFEAAQQVKPISPNAFGVLMGRLLEAICSDRGAEGKTLHESLNDLARKGEIPTKLVGAAMSLKNLRNIGAHSGSGDLGEDEVPIVDKLCRAVLEYVYSAPHLVVEAEQKIAALKLKKDGGAKAATKSTPKPKS